MKRVRIHLAPLYTESNSVSAGPGGAEADLAGYRRDDPEQFDVVSVERTPLLSRFRTNDDLSNADAAVLARADAQDSVAVIETMIQKGWYCAPDTYTRIVQKLVAPGN